MKSAYIGRDDGARRSDTVMAYRGGDVLLCGGFCEAPRQRSSGKNSRVSFFNILLSKQR